MNENQVNNENKKKNGCLAETKRFWSGIAQQFKEHNMLKVVAGTAIGAAAVTVGVLVVKKIKGKVEGDGDVIVELPPEGGSSDTEA